MSAWVWIAVVFLGGLGALARFLLDLLVLEVRGGSLPVGTFVVNIIGAFVLGLLTGLGIAGNLDVIADTATIGSFTTFSTWMLESYRLAEAAEPRPAVINLLVSLLLGFGAALLGRSIGLAL